MFLVARVLLLLVILATSLRPVASNAKGNGDCAGLVDIGDGRKIYLECRGTGSPTVVLVSGTRGARDDWTHVSDRAGPERLARKSDDAKRGAVNTAAETYKLSDSAVFPEVGRFTRVCGYDRPGSTRFDDTRTDSTQVQQPTTAQRESRISLPCWSLQKNRRLTFLSATPGAV